MVYCWQGDCKTCIYPEGSRAPNAKIAHGALMRRSGSVVEEVTGKTAGGSKPSASRALPAAGMSMSAPKPKHRKRRSRVGSVEIGKVAALKAEGFNHSEISRSL